jgi:hypothetical protein
VYRAEDIALRALQVSGGGQGGKPSLFFFLPDCPTQPPPTFFFFFTSLVFFLASSFSPTMPYLEAQKGGWVSRAKALGVGWRELVSHSFPYQPGQDCFFIFNAIYG